MTGNTGRDMIPHAHLREILDQRVTDGVVRRMIDKWLNAGVLEAGNLHLANEGTPQGGVISPALSNIFLHHVLDKWFEDVVRPRVRGKATLVRFADDFVMTFETYHDAKRVMDVLGKRLGRFGLALHPGKTHFIDFRPQRHGGTPLDCKAQSFDFLGFTHSWVKSRKGAQHRAWPMLCATDVPQDARRAARTRRAEPRVLPSYPSERRLLHKHDGERRYSKRRGRLTSIPCFRACAKGPWRDRLAPVAAARRTAAGASPRLRQGQDAR